MPGQSIVEKVGFDGRVRALYGLLRAFPALGPSLGWLAKRFYPRDTKIWAQIQTGPAGGLWMRLNPRTGRSYYEGVVEPTVQLALVQNLRPGMVFYDAGANIGFFSLLASRLVGASGRVVAFEADPENAARLRENTERNESQNIAVEEKAVWSQSGTVFFERCDPVTSPDRGLGYVSRTNKGTTCIAVPSTSLDDRARSGPAPDFIKCDVEGAEVEVFLGAQELLREKRPVVLCEMHSEANRERLEREFAKFGYVSSPCGMNHILALPGSTTE